MELDDPDRTIRVDAPDGSLQAGFKCRTLKVWKDLFSERKRPIANFKFIISDVMNLYDDIDVIFSTNGSVTVTPLWSQRFLSRLIRRARPDDVMPFKVSDIRTIEPAPAQGWSDAGPAIVTIRGGAHQLWVVKAYLHNGRVHNLVNPFKGQDEASFAATQLQAAFALIGMRMQEIERETG